jgi:hypothetical protein
MRHRFSIGPHATTVGFFLAAVLVMVAFHLVGTAYANGFALDLGSLNFPTPGYLTAAALWMPFGALAAILLAFAIVHGAGRSDRAQRLQAEWESLSDRRFLAWTMTAAVVIPFVIRRWMLHDAPLTDDESAYRFGAELLASGRLWAQSPSMKLFVDQNFIINDGRLYPAYFIGWQALMAPGVWFGATSLMNPLYSALTVPALIGVLTSLVGRSWARAGAVLFLAAPFIQITAATQLSHTTCLMALTWCLWMYLKLAETPASLRHHAAFAFAFGVAFCVRPQSTVPIGLPLLVAWALIIWRLDATTRARAVAAFAAPAGALALLFLGVLWAQNGSPWKIGYVRSAEYIIENRFRFTTFVTVDHNALPGFSFSQLGLSIARAASGLFRLNLDLFGWPSSLALLLFARPSASSGTRILWGMVGVSLVVQLFQNDWGIDTFGPVHALELALPILCLTIVGARYLSHWSVSSGFGAALLAALILTAWTGFVPIRLQAVRQIAAHLNVAFRAPEKVGLTRAIIFAPRPFAPPCGGAPKHFVFFRPTNDPDLTNDILWVNNVGPEENRRFVETLGGNKPGYTMRWTSQCEVALESLSR